MLIALLNLCSAAAAFIAAYFWWQSAKVEAPKELGVSRIVDETRPNASNPEKQWAKDVSKLNSKGAIAAGVAAFLMGTSTLISLDWSGIK